MFGPVLSGRLHRIFSGQLIYLDICFSLALSNNNNLLKGFFFSSFDLQIEESICNQVLCVMANFNVSTWLLAKGGPR